MDIAQIPLDQFQNFLLCFSRVGTLILAIPLLNGRQVPMHFKVGLALTTTMLLFPIMAEYTPKNPLKILEIGLLVINEVLLGAILGLITNLVFTAVTHGGTIIGYQMGFAAANIFDPQTTQQRSLMSQFQNVLAILLFFVLDIHHLYFRAIQESYILLPPGLLDFSSGAVEMLMKLGSHMFILSVKFTAPILITLLLSNMVLGILARIFPQLNVFLLSFPLNIGTSFLVIGLTLNIVFRILSREFDNMGENFFSIMQLL